MAPRSPSKLPKSHPRTGRKNRTGASATRNNAARNSGASRSTRSVPGWLWLVAGVGVGMLVTSLVKLAAVPSPDASPTKVEQRVQPASRPDKSARSEGAAPPKSETRFDFYTLLPEREVIVPDAREVTPPPKPATKPGEKAPSDTSLPPMEHYLLQAGSFRGSAEADRRRAQLLLLGLDARIEPVRANGDTWYRVHAGPFVSREKLTQARNLLSGEGIETLLLKQKSAG